MIRDIIKNREYQKKFWYKYHEQNKRKLLERTRKKQAIAKKFVYDFLSKSSCKDCGESDPVVLDFDHVRGKKYLSISRMTYTSTNIERIKEEIEKCEVRCANCHRRRHARSIA